MILALNLFAFALSIVIGVSIFVFNYKSQSRLFYIRTIIMLIPAFAELRQILVITGTLKYVPFYIFVVYFLLRLIGPLINWHAHLQFGKKINFFNFIHLVTYISWVYIFYLIFQFYVISPDQNPEILLQQFKEESIFAYTYPIVQLLHIVQAAFIVFQADEQKHKLAGFMKMAIVTVLISLIALQISYFLFHRDTVELIVAPIIFIVAFFALAVLNIKYANVFADKNRKMSEDFSTVEFNELTGRENEVLRKIAMGMTDKTISDELFISKHTVATYCRRIYTKLNVKNRTEASFLYNKRVSEKEEQAETSSSADY